MNGVAGHNFLLGLGSKDRYVLGTIPRYSIVRYLWIFESNVISFQYDQQYAKLANTYFSIVSDRYLKMG